MLAPPTAAPLPAPLSPDPGLEANSVRSLEIPGVLLKLHRNFVAAGSASTYNRKKQWKNVVISQSWCFMSDRVQSTTFIERFLIFFGEISSP